MDGSDDLDVATDVAARRQGGGNGIGGRRARAAVSADRSGLERPDFDEALRYCARRRGDRFDGLLNAEHKMTLLLAERDQIP
jgi:hypothetical protein